MKTKEEISKAAKESCKLHRHAMRYNHMIDQFKAGVNWYKEYADQETSALREELEDWKLKVLELRGVEYAKDCKIEELEKENASLLYDTMKDESIGLQSEIVDLNSQLRSAQVENERLEKAFSFINNACDERDKKIQSLSARVSELQGEVGMWEGKWDDLQKLYSEETTFLRNRIKALTN